MMSPRSTGVPRTLCSDLPHAEPGSTVRLQGWVHRRRELAALTFLVVRDRTGLAQVVVQWPPLAREGFRYEPRIDLHDEGLRRVLLLMGPGTIGMAATQINVFVNTVLATGQGTGAVSWLDYAFRLMYLPIGLFGVSVATASTPA